MKKILFILAIVALAMTSCLKDEAYVTPPQINIAAPNVMPDADITIEADITPGEKDVKILSVKITYTVKGVSKSGDMTLDIAPKYTYTIPAAINVDGAIVDYVIAVEASNGKISFKKGNYMVSNIDYSGLVINEVSGITGNKCVEIFNKGTEEVNLTGVAIYKNGSVYATIKASNKIAANGFATIGADGVQTFPHNVTVNQTTGGMSAKQTLLIELKTPSGTLLDTFQRGNAPWGTGISEERGSYSRIPDGTGAFKGATPSPGVANPISGGTDIPQS